MQRGNFRRAVGRMLAAGALAAPTPALADSVEACANPAEPWAQLSACTEVIDGGEWRGASAAWAHSNRAMAHAALGNHQFAFDDHDTAIRLDPLNPRAWNNRATSHAEFRQYDQALSDYAQALTLDPDYVTALINRASVYDEMKNPKAAHADYDQAIALEAAAGRETADLMFLRADMACRMGEVDASIRDRTPAMEGGLFPRAQMANLLTAKGYLREGGDFDTAFRAWTEAGCPWQ
ncbi:MAG: tetratricopeptide repeat protein [Pseudomonadota bacterium]